MKPSRNVFILSCIGAIATLLIIHGIQHNAQEKQAARITKQHQRDIDSIITQRNMTMRQWRIEQMGPEFATDPADLNSQKFHYEYNATNSFFKKCQKHNLNKLSQLISDKSDGRFYIEQNRFGAKFVLLPTDQELDKTLQRIPNLTYDQAKAMSTWYPTIGDFARGLYETEYNVLLVSLDQMGTHGATMKQDLILKVKNYQSLQKHAEQYNNQFNPRAQTVGYDKYCDSVYAATREIINKLDERLKQQLGAIQR